MFIGLNSNENVWYCAVVHVLQIGVANIWIGRRENPINATLYTTTGFCEKRCDEKRHIQIKEPLLCPEQNYVIYYQKRLTFFETNQKYVFFWQKHTRAFELDPLQAGERYFIREYKKIRIYQNAFSLCAFHWSSLANFVSSNV